MKKNATYHYYVEGEDEKSLMDALKRACEIRNIGELTNSKTTTDYKRDLIACTNLGTRLKKCGFDISKMWKQMPTNMFRCFGNDAEKIKLYNK